MNKIYSLLSALIFINISAYAQFSYTPETSYNTSGEYNDLGNSGLVISTTNKDDANSPAQAIGFTFSFNGTGYNYFILNTNGFIKLGVNSSMTSPSAAKLCYTYNNQNIPGGVLSSSNTADVNILSVFNHDLDSSSVNQTEYRFNTTGSTGNRICTIQWRNVSDKKIGDTASGFLPHEQFTDMNFQIKLHESNSMIEFIYGNFNPTSDSSLFKLSGVGIKASTTNLVTVTKSSSHEWHLARFTNTNYSTATPTLGFNWGNNNANIGKALPNCAIRPLPDLGRTFRFLPKVNNDAEVQIIYTKHADVIPWGVPHPIRARVTNVGNNTKTGTWVKVNVHGVNSYQDSTFINSLSVGTSSNATWTSYTPQNLGLDTITITLSNDAENINNTLEVIQKIGREEIGYADSSGGFSNFGWSAGSGIFAAKYNLAGKRRISKVQMKLGFNTLSVGQSVYGVVVDAQANILGRTPDYVIGCNDMGKWIELDVYGGNNTSFDRPPPLITNSNYYVGMAISASGHFPMALQRQEPTATGAYFYHGGLTSGGTYTDISTVTGLDVYAIAVNSSMDGTSLKLETVTSLNDPSCAIPNHVVEITVTNKDSIEVDFAVDTLHLEVSSTGAVTQSHSRLINTGTLAPDSSETYIITSNFDLSVAGQYDIIVEARQWLEVDTVNNYQFLTVNVVDTPDVTIDVTPDSILCFGSTFTFDATPYTAGSILYQWKVNGINSGPTTTSNTFNPTIDWGDTVSVDLITDHCTTGTFVIPSNNIMMQLNPKPKFINGKTSQQTVIQFTKKSYSIGINPGHTYLWKASGGTILTDSTGAAVQIDWGAANPNASVSVTETDGQNCVRDNILPINLIDITGIGENTNIHLGEAYPNPADATVSIPIYSKDEEAVQLALYDITGKKVKEIYSGIINGEQRIELNVSDLGEGMYFYKLTTSNGFVKVNRLSIKH